MVILKQMLRDVGLCIGHDIYSRVVFLEHIREEQAFRVRAPRT